MPNTKQKLMALYRKLADEPLQPDSEYYEPFLSRLNDDPIEELRARINFAASESLHLIDAQRGTGKSTELLRLQSLLAEDGATVFLTDIKDYLELTEPVEITSFMISAIASLADAVKEKAGLDALHESYWERLSHFLQSEVKLEGMTAGAKVEDFSVGLKASLRTDASFKKRLQEATKGHIAQLVRDANEFVTEMVTLLRKEDPDRRIVFIIDSLEQLRGTTNNTEEVHDSVVRLFNTYGKNLILPMLHVVITVPPYLIPLSPNITRYVGGYPITSLHCIHVKQMGDQNGAQVDTDGLNTMRAIVHRRNADAADIFTDAAIDQLAMASGGDLRDFFRMLRDSLIKSSTHLDVELPLSLDTIGRVKDSLRREMLPIANDDIRWLAKIAESKKAELPSIQELPRLARFFDGNLVLNYRNGEDWYDVHPLILKYVEERIVTLHEPPSE